MQFFDHDAVAARLHMVDLIHQMERALADLSTGKVVQPPRTVVPVADHDGFLLSMPVYGRDALGSKLVTVYPKNVERGLPSHLATVVLLDPATGAPRAVLDGELITTMRTAAVSAVAAKLLASPNASVLGIIGSGVQARAHVEALRLVRDIGEIRAWSPTRAHLEAFAAETGAHACGSAAEAAREADIVLTATASHDPVLAGAWLSPGTLVIAVGWLGIGSRELDDDVMRNTVVVDGYGGAGTESGDITESRTEVYAELGELVAGSRPLPPPGTTVFRSSGMAVEDLYAAVLVVG
jgi:thiomorpholine-carboxylate dehydrogenase